MKKIDKEQGLINYLLAKVEKAKSINVSKEQVLEMLDTEVFSDPDFKRHLLETSIKLGLSIDVVEHTVKHFIITMAKQMSLVTRYRRRLSIYAFCMIEIKDSITYTIKGREEYYINRFGQTITSKLFSIFKN